MHCHLCEREHTAQIDTGTHEINLRPHVVREMYGCKLIENYLEHDVNDHADGESNTKVVIFSVVVNFLLG